MAISTFGTTAATSLSALLTSGAMAAADIAAIATAIKDDLNVTHPVINAAFSSHNLLYVPNRGILKILPGDFVAVDNQGWPILVSANSIANSTWVHSP